MADSVSRQVFTSSGSISKCAASLSRLSGIPVATVAIDGAENAALLAVQMLALSDETLKNRLIAMKKTMAEGVLAKDKALADKLNQA